MNEIKKAINQIPLPEQLSQVTQASLNSIHIKKKRLWLLPSIAVLFLAVFSSSLVFSDYVSIPEFFQSKEEKLAQIDDSEMVVQSEWFTISLKRFIDYKENTMLIHEVNHIPYALTDLDLLNQIIEDELLLAEAKKAGITVTSDEVENYISEVELAFTEENDPVLKEIEAQLAKRLNVSVQEYYRHPETFTKYEILVLKQKFALQLYEDDVLHDGYNIDQYLTDLRLANGKSITIFKEKLLR